MFRILFLCMLCALAYSLDDLPSYYQKCVVQLPDSMQDGKWILEYYPAYCYLDKVPKTMNYDSKCISMPPVNYCTLSEKYYAEHIQIGPTPEPYFILYACNVYNASMGTFFYSGRIWPEYVNCKIPIEV